MLVNYNIPRDDCCFVEDLYNASTTKDLEITNQMIENTDKFLCHLKKMKKEGRNAIISNLCDRMVKEFDSHSFDDSLKLAEWINWNTSGSGKGAYPSVHNFFQFIAEIKEKPQLFSPVFDKSPNAMELLTLKLIDSAAYKHTDILEIDDVRKLILSEDFKVGGNLFRTSKKYQEMTKSMIVKLSKNKSLLANLLSRGMIDLSILKIESIADLITYLGAEECSKITKLVSIPPNFVFKKWKIDPTAYGFPKSCVGWKTSKKVTAEISLNFPNLNTLSFHSPKEGEAFKSAGFVSFNVFRWDTDFSFLQNCPSLLRVNLISCNRINELNSLKNCSKLRDLWIVDRDDSPEYPHPSCIDFSFLGFMPEFKCLAGGGGFGERGGEINPSLKLLSNSGKIVSGVMGGGW